MDNLFSGGTVIDGIVTLMALEGVVLLWVRFAGRRGLPPREVLTTLASGAALMLALRAAVVGGSGRSIGLWLVLALLAHGSDLALRWRNFQDT